MEQIVFIKKQTTDQQKIELVQKCLANCKFKIGDKVKVNCQNSPELVVSDLTVKHRTDYELDCVFLNNQIETIKFSKSSQKFERDSFSEYVLAKIDEPLND